MNVADFVPMLAFTRGRIEELVDAVAATGRAEEVLAWRPGPGRANLGWQLMHVAATDHRFLTLRFQGIPPTEPEFAKAYGFGSTPSDVPPSLEEIRRTQAKHRQALLALLAKLPADGLDQYPPAPPAGMPVPPPRTFREWLTLLVWHEAHHHGQCHLTLNLWKAAHPAAAAV